MTTVTTRAGKGARLQTFSMPDVGEGLTEAEVLSWHVQVGDTITVNQVMVEIETAKAAVELPSPFAGRVHALLVEPGVTVEVGTPIITVDTDPDAGDPAQAPPEVPSVGSKVAGEDNPDGAKIGEKTADGRIATLVGYVSAGASTTRRRRRGAPPTAAPTTTEPTVAAPTHAAPTHAATTHAVPTTTEPTTAAPITTAPTTAAPMSAARGADRELTAPAPEPQAAAVFHAPLAAPPVRKLAKDLGIELGAVHPTRPDGVISRSDVETAAASHTLGSAPAGSLTGYDPSSRERRVPVRGIRRATAAAMVASAFSAPHVTEFLTIDVTPMMELRERLRLRPEFADVKLTPLAFAARAVCLAARRTPELNAFFESGVDGSEDQIVVKEYINLGIAAATPRGLIVPVIHDADSKDLAGLAAALRDLAATARAGHTTLTEMTGGTFTITNVGVFGVDTGTPIINPGEAAILALGSIKDAPWVVDGQLAVRKVCQLALSFDHRVVDGQQGSTFLADVGALLADPGLALAF